MYPCYSSSQTWFLHTLTGRVAWPATNPGYWVCIGGCSSLTWETPRTPTRPASSPSSCAGWWVMLLAPFQAQYSHAPAGITVFPMKILQVLSTQWPSGPSLLCIHRYGSPVRPSFKFQLPTLIVRCSVVWLGETLQDCQQINPLQALLVICGCIRSATASHQHSLFTS